MKYALRNGKRWEETSFQDTFLRGLYESLPGRMALKVLVHPAVSRLGGRVMSSGLSCCMIRPFVKSHHINVNEWETVQFFSYNDFFTRKLKKSCRPMPDREDLMISPCDGKLTVYPITEQGRFRIKNTPYTVSSLLRNRKLAERYQGGYAMVFRLTVDDYHRYCYIDDGVKSSNYRIPGVLHTVNPIANDLEPVYKENTREFCLIHTQHFGTILQMEVGAMMVGKICNYHGAEKVKRGQEKGRFEFGGSTVILLVQPGKISVDEDIMGNSQDGYETIVKMGEAVARKKSEV